MRGSKHYRNTATRIAGRTIGRLHRPYGTMVTA
jgi:hypothetical protein